MAGGGEEEGDRCLASASLVPVQGERGKRGKPERGGGGREREREAGRAGERSGTRRNWLSSGGYWGASPAKPRGGIFKCFFLFLVLFICSNQMLTLQRLIRHLSNLSKSLAVSWVWVLPQLLFPSFANDRKASEPFSTCQRQGA